MSMESEIKKRCFVIGPIGEEGSETRKRSDQLLKYVIDPVAKEHGYDVDRADKMSKPGIITNQVIESIVDSELVIADLTERNPNVFYELAIRHGLQKPFIHIVESSERIPFDIAGVRAVQININDLDSVFSAKTEISNQLKSIEVGEMPIENPISVSFDMQKLRQSDKPSDRIQADIVQWQAEIQRSIRRLEERITAALGARDNTYKLWRVDAMDHQGKNTVGLQDYDSLLNELKLFSKEDRQEQRNVARHLAKFLDDIDEAKKEKK